MIRHEAVFNASIGGDCCPSGHRTLQLLRSSQKKKFRIRFECYALQQASFCIIPGSTASLGRLGATARKKHDSPRSYGAQRTPELGSSGGLGLDHGHDGAEAAEHRPSTGRAPAKRDREAPQAAEL